MKQKKLKERGITLIALIITIIILLILAGVTIKIVIDNNIIGKTQTAVEKYSEEQAKENLKFVLLNYKIGKLSGEEKSLEDYLIDANATVSNVEDGNYTVIINGYEFKINENTLEIEGEGSKVEQPNPTEPEKPEEKITYIVNFDANGGELETNEKTVTFGSTYGELPTPTKEGYAFNGWYTLTTGGTEILSTTKVTITENQTLYAQWSQAVAKVGSKNYASIQEAINSIQDNSTQTTITVIEPLTISSQITNTKNVILDLGGNTITTSSYIYNNGGTLQITNGTIDSSGSYCVNNTGTLTLSSGLTLKNNNRRVIYNADTGNITLDGAIIEGTPTEKNYAPVANYGIFTMNSGTISSTSTISTNRTIGNYGTFTMNSGEIKASGTITGCITNAEGATAYIYGGTLDAKDANGTSINNSGTMTIGKNDATLNIYGRGTEKVTIYNNGGGKMTILNGNIYGESTNAIKQDSGELYIEGGTITSNNTYPTVYINGGIMNMTGGTVINSSGGRTIYNEGGTATKTGGTAENTYGVN